MPQIYIKITWKVKDPVWCNKTTSTGDGMDPWLVSFLPNNNYNWVECELSTWEHREHGINPAMIVKETIESKCWVRPVPQLEGHPTYKILVAPFPFSCVIIRLESVPIRGWNQKSLWSQTWHQPLWGGAHHHVRHVVHAERPTHNWAHHLKSWPTA